MTETIAALAGLFAAALGAATILPFQSEVVFVALILETEISFAALLFTASVGNTLGSQINWVMGRFIERFRDNRWFPVTEKQLARAQDWYLRWGVWTLLLSWAPFGDAFTVVAGVMRTPFWLFSLLVGAVKTARYVAVGWAAGAF
jgi:membrane protein YqaA with SNARE-associated domain